MSTTTHRLLISCGLLAAVMCVCLGLVSVAGAGTLLALPTFIETTTQIPGTVEEQMDAIEQNMVELRQLEPQAPLERVLLSPEQLRQNVLNDFFDEFSQEEARDFALELAAFGLLQPDYDLYNLYIDLYSEQVAGYYDTETATMYVISQAGFGGPERMTYAHEYVHALQDQNFDFENGLNFNDETCESDSEYCAAVQALIEGDASLLQLQWLSVYGTRQDMEDITAFYQTFASPVLDAAPQFLSESFMFPYVQGQEFVQYIYAQGGTEAINAVYLDPPVSTEQILHPERYPADRPVTVTLPAFEHTLGDGWREIAASTMGEYGFYLVLAWAEDPAARLDDKEAQAAAAGWGGDAYAVYHQAETEALAMVLSAEWDTEDEAREFYGALTRHLALRFGPPTLAGEAPAWDAPAGYTSLRREGSRTVWILAPDEHTAAALAAALQP